MVSKKCWKLPQEKCSEQRKAWHIWTPIPCSVHKRHTSYSNYVVGTVMYGLHSLREWPSLHHTHIHPCMAHCQPLANKHLLMYAPFCLSHGYSYSSQKFRKRAYQILMVYIKMNDIQAQRHSKIQEQISNCRNRQWIKTKSNEQTSVCCCFSIPPLQSGNDFKSEKHSRL